MKGSGILIKYLMKRNIALAKYYAPEQAAAFQLASKVIRESAGVTVNEAVQIFRATKATEGIHGDIAEVGVYTGCTAQIICEAKMDRPLHLFDTFEGLPEPTERDNPEQFHKGELSCNMDAVKARLKGYENVHFYKGLFPGTSGPVKDRKFSFVNLDVDLYDSTRDCLTFFYSRLEKGGLLMSHDYFTAVGVRQAFEEFFKGKTEPVIPLVDDQCMIVKLS